MPRVREYTSEVGATSALPEGRRATGADLTSQSQVGAGLVDAGESLFRVAEQNEVSDVQAKIAKARADWTVHLAQRAAAAPAGDETFSQKFNDDFSQYLQTLEGNYSTRAGTTAFRRAAAELSAHFVEKSGVYQAHSAGVKAKQDYLTALDANRNTLLADPTQFESVYKTTIDSLNDPAGPYAKMPSDQRAVLERQTKEQMALSAVEGIIKLDPREGLKQLSDGKWSKYLDADKTFTLKRTAEIGIRAEEVEAERKVRVADRELKKAQEAEKDNVIRQIFPAGDKPSTLTAPDIANNRKLDPDQKPLLISMLARETKPDPLSQISAATSSKLFTRIHLPDGDPEKIIDETLINQKYVAGELNRTDLAFLRKEIADSRTPDGERLGKKKDEFYRSIEPSIDKSNPLMGKLDATGKQQMFLFRDYVEKAIDQRRKDGLNPYDLFDPSKPEFIGKPEVTGQFQKTLQQSMTYIANQMRRAPGAAAATGSTPDDKIRKPGETIEAWRARTGAK